MDDLNFYSKLAGLKKAWGKASFLSVHKEKTFLQANHVFPKEK